MHEQSETVQRRDGRWENVYGRKTPMSGLPLPRENSWERDDYATVNEADRDAGLRSKVEGVRGMVGPELTKRLIAGSGTEPGGYNPHRLTRRTGRFSGRR